MNAEAATSFPEFEPDLVDDFVAGLAARWIDRGMDAGLASRLADEAGELLRERHGGTKIYIATGERRELALRDAEIGQQWNGRNTDEFCRRYRISESRVRQIAEAWRKRSGGAGR